MVYAQALTRLVGSGGFSECPTDCESCANTDTCTRCAEGFFHLQGKCYDTCPEEYEPSDLLVECIPQGELRETPRERETEPIAYGTVGS